MYLGRNRISSARVFPACALAKRLCSQSLQKLRFAKIFELPSEGAVLCSWNDGVRAVFAAKWLRENCRCPLCYHHTAQQRLVNTALITESNLIERITQSDSSVTFRWTTKVGTHACMESTFQSEWLRNHAPLFSSHRQQLHSGKCLWDNTFSLPVYSYQECMRCIKQLLHDLYRYGLVLVHDAPNSIDKTRDFARELGSIVETLHGVMWSTQTDTQARNEDTAYSNASLAYHTDGTYMREPPGLQIFNCVRQSHIGGESHYVDMFHIAEVLKAVDFAAYQFLGTIPVRFHYLDAAHHLEALEPIFKFNMEKGIDCVRFNDYDRAPQTHLPLNELNKFYKNHEKLSNLINDPEFCKTERLEEGMMVVVDNHRVAHARSRFFGKRSLVGCYIARSDYESRLRKAKII